MKKVLSALAAVLLLGVLFIVSKPAQSNQVASTGNEKVTICHIPPGNPANAHSITVSINAVPAHLAHGDAIGQCSPPSE